MQLKYFEYFWAILSYKNFSEIVTEIDSKYFPKYFFLEKNQTLTLKGESITH